MAEATFDGARVHLDARAASALVPLLSSARRAARRNGADLPPYLLDVLTAFRAAESSVASARPDVVSQPRSDGFPPATMEMVDANRVARLSGLSPQAVRRAARDGRLAGQRGSSSGEWQFTQRAVHKWIQEREARLAILAARRDTARTAPVAQTDEQQLRGEFDALAAQVAAIEQALNAAESERDAAIILVAASQARGDSVAVWRSTEALERAEATVAELVPKIAPLRLRRDRLMEPLGALERKRRELIELRGRLGLLEREVVLKAKLDALMSEVEEAVEYRRLHGVGDQVAKPLRDLVKAPGGSVWSAWTYRLANVEALRGAIARAEIEAGA